MSTGRPQIKGIEHLRQVAAKALDDDTYRQQLVADPAGVLRQEGIAVPEGVQVTVHQNTEDQIHLALPTEIRQEHQLSVDETNITTLNTALHF